MGYMILWIFGCLTTGSGSWVVGDVNDWGGGGQSGGGSVSANKLLCKGTFR